MDIGKKTDRIIIITIICIAVIFTFLLLKPGGKAAKDTVPGASAAADTSGNEGQDGGSAALTPADYAGKRIGSSTGTTYDQTIMDTIPNAVIEYFDTYGDMEEALLAGKIDAFCADEPAVRSMMAENSKVARLPDLLESYGFAFAFRKDEKGKALRDEMSDFIIELRKKGVLDKLEQKWFEGDSTEREPPDLKNLKGENGTIKMSYNPETPPFDTLIEGKPAGLEVDLAYMFCLDRGYGLDIEGTRFSSILPSLQAGACDIGASSFTVTEERAESVYFSEPHYIGGAVLAVRSSDIGLDTSIEKQGFWQGVALSFERTFIRENRWKMIVEGILTTCFITVFSAVIGTLMAFLLCLFRRTESTLANLLTDAYVRIFQGTPMIVVLMILYYIVFRTSTIPAVWVAVIGFSMNLAAYGSEIMRSGIESIDSGQEEAALALGFTRQQAFFSFIFPQALIPILPVYRGEMINLLKSTSIVGFIAIQDLTKMSDIIRSRTYEAFFPLLSTAFIYFVLSWIISFFMRVLLLRADWKHSKRSNPKVKARSGSEPLPRSGGRL